ncbi:MAG: 2-oxo-4-hydroxy-4-carboxy-5-ureidoimidazoline decarboxylase [Gemmatimonadota bacterium]
MSETGVRALNALPPDAAEERLLSCCGSRAWARAMTGARPFRDAAHLAEAADALWWGLTPRDWLEAFAAHPRIGEHAGDDGRAAAWSRAEQEGAAGAPDETTRAIEAGNRSYEERFGHVFLIRAAGRSAVDMLSALTARMSNDPETELRVAAAQQAEITRLRLAKLLEE